jgi:hypothetical protein
VTAATVALNTAQPCAEQVKVYGRVCLRLLPLVLNLLSILPIWSLVLPCSQSDLAVFSLNRLLSLTMASKPPLVHLKQYTYAIPQDHHIFKALATTRSVSTSLTGLSDCRGSDWHMHLHSEGSGKPHPSADIASLLAMTDPVQPHSRAFLTHPE